jgi:hypothetical protein
VGAKNPEGELIKQLSVINRPAATAAAGAEFAGATMRPQEREIGHWKLVNTSGVNQHYFWLKEAAWAFQQRSNW